jgi:Zn-dependent metalloprotease
MAMMVGALRSARTTPTQPVLPKVDRITYDAGQSEFPAGGFGKVARTEGQGPTGNPVVDAAHDNAGLVHEFFSKVLGRNSLDDRGMQLKSVVHYGRSYNNAYWDGEKMTYGDGDGKMFKPLALALDVVGHEMAHGVIEHTANLRYHGQSGALNESWGDVFGEVIEQWARNRAGFGTTDAAKAATWLIGEDVFTPGTPGDALRSMRAPGTAYKGDPQPAHMRDYKNMTGDNGGVHVNSGIPNKAAYEAAIRIGSEKLAKIWYTALTDYLRPTSTFTDAANATLTAAVRLYGTGSESQAVADAWNAVGLVAKPKAAAVFGGRTTLVPDAGHAHSHSHGERDGVVPAWLRSGVVDRAQLVALGAA